MPARDHMHADIAGMAHDVAHDRAVQQLEPARALRLAHHDLRDVIGARIGQHILGDISAAWDRDRFALKLFGNPQRVGDAVALDLRKVLAAPGFDIDRGPWRVQPVGQPLGVAHKPCRAGVLADADEEPFARGPRPGDGVRAHVGQELLVHALRGAA